MSQGNWADLFNWLTTFHPVVIQGQISPCERKHLLKFSPQILMLPADVQCNLLHSIIKHRRNIQTNCIEHLCKVLRDHPPPCKWAAMLLDDLLECSVVESSVADGHGEDRDIECRSSDQSAKKLSNYEIYSFCKNHADRLSDSLSYVAERKNRKENSDEKQDQSQDHENPIVKPQPENVLNPSNDDVIVIDGDSCDENVKILSGTTNASKSPGIADGAEDGNWLKVTEITREDKPVAMADSLASQSFLCSQVSQVVTDCPLENYSGTLLSPSCLVKLATLKETWREGRGDEAVPEELSVFIDASHHEVAEMCEVLQVEQLMDSGLSVACAHLESLSNTISHANITAFTTAAFTQRVVNLNQPIARSVLSTLTSFTSSYPRAITDCVIVPCLRSHSGINVHQADCFSQVIAQVFSPPARLYLLEQLVSGDHVISEGLLNLIHSLLEKQTPMSDSCITQLLSSFETNVAELSTDLKFTKLLVLFLENYSNKLLPPHVTALSMIAAHNKTLLRRSLQNSIKKLTA